MQKLLQVNILIMYYLACQIEILATYIFYNKVKEILVLQSQIIAIIVKLQGKLI